MGYRGEHLGLNPRLALPAHWDLDKSLSLHEPVFSFVKRGNSELWGLDAGCGGDGGLAFLLTSHFLSGPSFLFIGLSLQFSLKKAPTRPSQNLHAQAPLQTNEIRASEAETQVRRFCTVPW